MLRLQHQTLQTAGKGLSLQLQANWNANYSITPVDDPDQLRRIRAIYQYTTGYKSEYDFESDYPIIEVSGSSGSASSNTSIMSGHFVGKGFDFTIGGNKPAEEKKQYVRRACQKVDMDTGACKLYTWLVIKPDLTFIKMPGCIMCDLGNQRTGKPNVIVLQKNPNLAGRTCTYEDKQELSPCKLGNEKDLRFFFYPGESPGSNAFAVASNGPDTLYVKGRDGLAAFNELALFTQEAASQGTGSPASGGQSNGRKTEPLQRISVPVGALGTTTP